ncbi:MAG: vWA domain-containing protein [Verrucomicrobiota bacterium]
MSLGAPQYLLLIPLFILIGWFWKRLELWRPLRALLLLVLIFALCDPQFRLRSDSMDLWVLMDRSASAREMVEEGADEWKSLILRSKPGRGNEVHFIDYASEVVSASNAEATLYGARTDQTRTGLAINDSLARMKADRHNRILIFTDGYSTEPLTEIASRLSQTDVPLDYRLLRPKEAIDYRITDLSLPSRSQPAEPFVVDGIIQGKPDGTVPLSVYRGDRLLFERDIEIVDGIGRIRFADRIAQPGAHLYRAEISPATDAYAQNNRREQWIEIVAGPRILLVTRYRNDPLATTLANQGFTLEIVEEPLTLSPGSLSGARAVVLNNVPAYELPGEFLNALDFFVREQGGGFLMAGGKNSFGSGGYYQSAVDELLPVTMELKSEHRRLSVAMAIVMDRSGSMGAITPSGNSKMQLANEGAARAVELLGETDAVTVFAVDSQAHEVAPLLNVGSSRGELIRRVRGIESMGGGIFVYTGMNAAWEQLKKAEAGQRHMILFTDAADSEEPGKYKELIEEMQADGATVSVIGLGTRADADAAFIEDIATRGQGRMFFTTIPGEIPNIFAQETVSVARSTFVEDPVETQSSGKWYEIAQRDMEWPAKIDGYNLSYLREGDETALVSTDRYAAPLVAFGRRGIGRTSAVSFPLGGEFSDSVRSWSAYGDFQQTLARWLIGEEVPSGIAVRHELTGSELQIDLLYDSESWSEKFAASPPRLMVQRGTGSAEAENLTWQRIAPGHFTVRTEVRESEPLRGAVQIGGQALPFGPVVAGSALEWEFDHDRVSELVETSRTSGGGELLDLSQAWRKPEATGVTSVREWFFLAALLVFLVEALVTRTGWKMPQRTPQQVTRPRPSSSKKPAKAHQPETEESPEPEPEITPPAAAEPKTSRKSRFQKAKKRL